MRARTRRNLPTMEQVEEADIIALLERAAAGLDSAHAALERYLQNEQRRAERARQQIEKESEK